MNWITRLLERAGGSRESYSGDAAWKDGELEREMASLVTRPGPAFCVDPGRCVYPNCGCEQMDKLEKEGRPMSMSTYDGGEGQKTAQKLPSVHEPVAPFGAPAMKAQISDAYRAAAKDIASVLDHMMTTCEEARQTGLLLIDKLNEAGEHHDRFLSGYASVQTQAAAMLRDTWKKQLDDLARSIDAQKAAAAAATPEGETNG